MIAVVGIEYSGGSVFGPVVVVAAPMLVLLPDEEVEDIETEGLETDE